MCLMTYTISFLRKKERKNIIDLNSIIHRVSVTHSSGMVLLSKSFGNTCIEKDIQMYGAFITAVQLFLKDITNESSEHCNLVKQHKLREIKLNCSTLFIENKDDYSVSCHIPNSSPFILHHDDELRNFMNNILSTYLIFKDFIHEIGMDLITLEGYSNEFEKSIDNFLHESLQLILGNVELNENGSEFEIYQTQLIE